MKMTGDEARREMALHRAERPQENDLRCKMQVIERETRTQYDADTGTVHPHLVITKRTGWQEF